MRRISASAIEDLYMCPARALYEDAPEPEDADTTARDYGNRAHAWWERGEGEDEFGWLGRPTEFLREIQVWYDIRTGRGGARMPPAPRYYDDLPPWYLVGTADAARRVHEGHRSILEIWDLKTGNVDGRTGQHRAKDTAQNNRQLLTLAMGLYYMCMPRDRPDLVRLGILNAPSREVGATRSTTWEFSGRELEAHFARLVYNPVAKVRSAELHVLQGGARTDWTNPGSQCYVCRADGCTARKERKAKKPDKQEKKEKEQGT